MNTLRIARVLLTVLAGVVVALPLLVSALEVPVVKPIKPITPFPKDVSTMFNTLLGDACERLGVNGIGLFPRIIPGFCTQEPTPPPPPPPPPEPEPEGVILISEVMYNPPGDDTNREWIEIMNGTSEPVDLSGWMLFESGTNRALTLKMGSVVIPPGGFAVVTPNDVVFLTNWSDFEGTLFDTTSFTLLNTGETLALKNAAGEIVDEIAYAPEDGANGDGNSLHRVGDGWVASTPTPGAPAVLP